MAVRYSIIALLLCPLLGTCQEQEARKLIPKQIAGKWGYVDASGNIVIAPMFDEAGRFSEGLAAVAIRSTPADADEKVAMLLAQIRWGFINEEGEPVIALQFGAVGDFSEGLARVKVGEDLTGQWGYINMQGGLVIAPQFAYAEDFKGGYAAVGKGKFTARWGRKRVSVVQLEFRGKRGFIDKSGKFSNKPPRSF